MDERKTLAALTLCALLLPVGCNRGVQDSSRNPSSGQQTTQKVETKYYASEYGQYTIPLDVAHDAIMPSAIMPPSKVSEAKKTNEEFVRKHSSQGKWTFMHYPVELLDKPVTVNDQFYRVFPGDKLAFIGIFRIGKREEIGDFKNRIENIETYVEGSMRERKIFGQPAICWSSIEGGKRIKFASFVYKDSHYTISSQYAGGEDDPENTFKRICDGIKPTF